MSIRQNTLMLIAASLTALSGFSFATENKSEAKSLPTVTVYKSPTCGCCGKWVQHMTSAGFEVVVEDHPNLTPIKKELGVPPSHRSCHTAVIGEHFFEGHIPPDDIKRFLKSNSESKGLAVPGMPMGSPGMEGRVKHQYDVIEIGQDGGHRIFSTHNDE